MKKRDVVVIVGLTLAIFLAVFLSPFASAWPDGLEKVAEQLGFIHLSEGKPVLTSPIPDYLIPGLKSEAIATALAGLFGTLITFGLVYLFGKVILARRRDS
jgi:cobalt/nickel transport protein